MHLGVQILLVDWVQAIADEPLPANAAIAHGGKGARHLATCQLRGMWTFFWIFGGPMLKNSLTYASASFSSAKWTGEPFAS